MAEVTQTAAAMTQALIGVPHLLTPPELHGRPLEPREGTVDLGDGFDIHLQAMRLIATRRRHELSADPVDWYTRLQEVQNRHPLAVRKLGCKLMSLHNQRRLAPDGTPLDNPAAANTGRISFSELLQEWEDFEPRVVARHLRYAGYFASIPVRDSTSLPRILARIYPADARDYLNTHPPIIEAAASDMTRDTLATKLGVTRKTLSRLLRDAPIYPTVYMSSHAGPVEAEYYDDRHLHILRPLAGQPPPPGKNEMLVSTLSAEYKHSALFTEAFAAAGIPTFDRKAANGHAARTLNANGVNRMRKIMIALTTPLPGEQDSKDIEKEIGVSLQTIYNHTYSEDILEGRKLYSLGGANWHYIFPAHVAERIKARIRLPRLPPYLISEAGIVKRNGRSGSHIYDTLRKLAYEHSDQDTQLSLFASRPNRPPRCRSWMAMLALEGRLKPLSQTIQIEWERLPYVCEDLDPQKIEYARWVQRQYVHPNHVDNTPIEEYVARTLAAIESGSLPVLDPYAGMRRGKREHQPIRSASGVVLPSETILSRIILPLAQQIGDFPAPVIPGGQRPYGKYGPAKAHRLLEMLHRHEPPAYYMQIPLIEAGRIRMVDDLPRVGLTLGDLERTTDAPAAVLRESIDRWRSQFSTPFTEVRKGYRMERYEGGLLEAILIDVVGLNIEQMANRTGASNLAIAGYLQITRARANANGRYCRPVWERIQTEFKRAPGGYKVLEAVWPDVPLAELRSLAAQLGIAIIDFYTVDSIKAPHVNKYGGRLIEAQFTLRHPSGKPYAPPRYGWTNRYDLAAATGTTPAQVDQWMNSTLGAESETEWCLARIPELPHIKVLPYYAPTLYGRYRRTIGSKTDSRTRLTTL